MYLLHKLFITLRTVVRSCTASFSIIATFSIVVLLVLVRILIAYLDMHYKKNIMENANSASILFGAAKMVNNFSHLGDNITNYSKNVVINNAKNSIRNHIGETLLSASIFDKSDLLKIVDHAKISIDQDTASQVHMRSQQSDLKNNHIFYHMSVKTSYDYHVNFLKNLFNDLLYNKIVVYTPAFLSMETRGDIFSFVQFIVDLSGSMNCSMDYPPEQQTLSSICMRDKKRSKITALKNTMLLLLNSIDSISNSRDRFYMGLVGYTKEIVKTIPPSWGTANIRKYITYDMDAVMFGETNSAPAMKKSYKELTASNRQGFLSYIFRHRSKVPHFPFQKYIVFLTDGENNLPKSDEKTLKICEKAKKHSIRIFAISIHSPRRGQDLLKKCVGSKEDYFNVIDSSSLRNVFQKISTVITQNKYQVVLKG
ncbi:MAG: VWA domain-containing protein [Candidatus Liberibacter ctenarytainae]|uniref:VWA domain-containing protein n=1 Tax=Candidatus Liberibacter ctenarytainae TaxID=2020335 RepID=A0A937AFG9_9HYPH|nr:VWA domain-containing protein [Candidatus Liberibacter ctenarytainae]